MKGENGILSDQEQRLSHFVANISHDLRSPIAGIVMRLNLLLERYGSQMVDHPRELVEKSLAAAERAVDTIQAMYEYTKIGVEIGDHEPVNINEIVNQILDDISPNSQTPPQINCEVEQIVSGDTRLIRGMFLNLIINAHKYSDKRETKILIYQQPSVKTSINSNSALVEIIIEDNGPGIPSTEAEHVFQMFKRGSTATDTDGLGVGLTAARRISQLHGGDLILDLANCSQNKSKKNIGARFILTLPAFIAS